MLFQYDDVDGYRYVVFDFWKTISYRVRISNLLMSVFMMFVLCYLNHICIIDGGKTQTTLELFLLTAVQNPINTIQPQNVTIDMEAICKANEE